MSLNKVANNKSVVRWQNMMSHDYSMQIGFNFHEVRYKKSWFELKTVLFRAYVRCSF